jgi:hypothetical protein
MAVERMTAETKNSMLDWAKEHPVKAAILGGVGIFAAESIDMCAAIDGNGSVADPVLPDYLSGEQIEGDHTSVPENVSFEIDGIEYTAAMPR